MLIPGIVFAVIFAYYPLYGLIIAFQKYVPTTGFHSPWVGLGNYEYLFRQPNFVRTIWNTFYIALMKIIFGIVVPVIFALLLNEIRSTRTKRLFQTVVYMPNFLSWVILSGVMIEILANEGIVNLTLGRFFGIEPINFLSDAQVFPWTVVVSDIWKGFGFGTVIYLAALTSIDPGLYEAAVVDGAKRWKQTRYITLPLLMPTVMLMIILSLGNVLNAGFDQIYNLYSPIVYKTGDIIDTYVYRLGIEKAQYSMGAAVGMFKSVINFILLLLANFTVKFVTGHGLFS
ncbi:MAG: ABC transporter permease subunit [Clostridia bacterium]|nr:ABC transporter permease subunit [Clostridia bacterium]